MTGKKKKIEDVSVTTQTFLMATVELPAGRYSKARLLDIILGFDKEIETPVTATESIVESTPAEPKTEPSAAALAFSATVDENKALMAWKWPGHKMPVGVPCLRLVFAVFAWLRVEPGRMASAIAALHADGKSPKLKKSLSEFADFIGGLPVSDSTRWLFTVIASGNVTSVKAVHEALAQINSDQLVSDLWKWGLSYVAIVHNTDAALAASANNDVIQICRGEVADKAYSSQHGDEDVNLAPGNVVRRGQMETMADGTKVGTDHTGLTKVITPGIKEPDAVVEPLGYGPPGDDLVEMSPGGNLYRETDVQTDVTPKEKLKGSASSIMKALRDSFNKLGALKTVELANKMSTLPPDKSLGAVVKLMGMVNCADEAGLLTELVEAGHVSISEIESIFRDEWQPLYTSLVAGLRTTGPIPPWINGGLLAQKTA